MLTNITPLSPSPNEYTRYAMIDALRGFALMGLFIVHMVEYFELYWYNPQPGWVHELIFGIFGGKAYALFALLFGVSFHIMHQRSPLKGRDFSWRFSWRLTLLCLLGYLHGVLYSGDILQVLAVCGFLLVVLQRLSNKALIIIATFFLMQFPLIIQVLYFSLTDQTYGTPLHWSLMGSTFDKLANGRFFEVLINNSFNGQLGKWAFFVENGRLYTLIAMFITGFVIARCGMLFSPKAHVKTLLIGLIGATLVAILFSYLENNVSALSLLEAETRTLRGVMANVKNTAIMIIELCLVVIAYQYTPFKKILDLQGPAGRCSLSFYVLQSLIGVTLFYGYGLGLFASLSQPHALYLGITLWICQVMIAHMWVKFFLYGPLEWLWRAATLRSLSTPFLRINRTQKSPAF